MPFNFCRFYNKIQIKVNGIVDNPYEKKESVNILIGVVGLVFLIPILIILLICKGIYNIFSKIFSYIPKSEKISMLEFNGDEFSSGIVLLVICGITVYLIQPTQSLIMTGIVVILLWIFGTLGIAMTLHSLGIKKVSDWLLTYILEKPITYLWNRTTSQCDLVNGEPKE